MARDSNARVTTVTNSIRVSIRARGVVKGANRRSRTNDIYCSVCVSVELLLGPWDSGRMKELRISRGGLLILLAIGVVVMVYLLYAVRDEYVEETVKISELLSASISLAEVGGAKIIEVRKIDSSEIGQMVKGLTKEGKSEYVTFGDRKSHEIITSGLRAVWPRLRFRSEENDQEVFSVLPPSRVNMEVLAVANRDEVIPLEKVAVWIDPLDATQEYTEAEKDEKLLQYVTVMVCIAVEGEPIAGVIHQPYATNTRTGKTGVTKWAWVGHGVSRSLQRDISSKSTDEGTVRVIASRSHPGDVFSVADSSFQGYKTVEKLIAAGAGYKALQVCMYV